MTPYTPGPWCVEPDQPSHGCSLAIVSPLGTIVARTPETDEYDSREQVQIDLPNARLLAAAPEMAELLLALHNDWTEFETDEPINGADLVEYIGGLRLQLLAVLAKAELLK